MVLFTLTVDAIELSETAVGTDDVSITKQAPNLTKIESE